MTPAQINELRSYISSDATLKAMATAGQDNDIVEEIIGRTETVIDPKAMIGSRGIVAILDVVDGEAFIKAMEDFTDAVLEESNPMKPYQAGVKRQLAWLDRDAGLEIGNARTRAMLDAFAGMGIVNASHAGLIKASAEKTVSVPEAKGWGGVSHMDVAKAVRDSAGNLLV